MYREKGLDFFFYTDLVLGKIVVRERNDDLSLLLANYEFPSLILYVHCQSWAGQGRKNKDLFSKTINNKWPWISKHNQL